jgi:uncharacterized phage-associated protein
MRLLFNVEKATQAAAYLLERRGGRMSYMKLLKLLYLADREALVSLGRPITYDRYVSMDHGPVLSQTYNLIASEPQPGRVPEYWRQVISAPQNYEVALLAVHAPTSSLSAAQIGILDDVFAAHGAKGRWELVDFVHTLPEWVNPHGSSIPISVRDVLLASGMDEEEAEGIEEGLLAEAALDELLA